MRIKFWGVPVSTPTPQPENMRYGGNTSCVEVRVGGRIYIFDCGTGFRMLGQQLQSEFGEKTFSARCTRIRRAVFFFNAPLAPVASSKSWQIRWPRLTSQSKSMR